jgi:transposase
VTRRHALTDAQWELLRPLTPSRPGPTPKLDDRTFIDAVLYRAKTGVPWRDLPERFGSWKTIYNRFSNWSHRGHWAAIFKALKIETDDEGMVILDASVIRAHQDAAGGKGGSKLMHWVVLEVGSPQRSTRSSTPKGDRSTSRSRPVNNTSRRSPKESLKRTRAAKHS